MVWAPDYVTLAEAKANLRIPEADTADDADLQLHITAASRNVDRFAGRQFGKVDALTERYYTARWDRDERRWYVDTDDIHAAAGLAVAFDAAGDGTYSLEVTGAVLEPRNAPADGKPWERLRLTADTRLGTAQDAVRVSSPSFGWAAFPKPVRDAVHLQLNRFFVRRNSPYGVAGSPELGNEMRLLNKLDPDVEVMVRPFQRYWAGV
jgi:hypothetical protein